MKGGGDRGEGKRGLASAASPDWPSLLTLYSSAKPLVLISSWTWSWNFSRGTLGN